MRLKPVNFYRRVGIRQREELVRPRLTPLEQFTFPYPAIYHFVPDNGVTLGPSVEDPLIASYDARVFIQHITELKSRVGNPRITSVNARLLENDYRRKTRGFKPLKRDEALTMNIRNGLVVNYGMLYPLYRYVVSFQASYYRWRNIQETVWQTVSDIDRRFGWDQFIDMELPEQFPGREDFIRLNASRTEKSLSAFNSYAGLALFDLWQWMGEDRDQSAMAHLTPEAVKNLNLIVKVKGYFFVLNLGKVDQWRKTEENPAGLDPTTLQARLLILLHGLRDLAQGLTTPDDISGELSDEPDEFTGILPNVTILRVPEPTSRPEPPEPLTISTRPTDVPVTPDKVNVEDVFTQRIKEQTRQLSEIGVMTAKAADRVERDSRRFEEIKDPFGSGKTMAEAMKVTPDDLTMPEDTAIKDRTTIIDKSMLNIPIKKFHQKYVGKLLNKHVMQSVMSLQNLGVMVKDYQVETVLDSMNHYQIHSVTVKPVRGRQSTLRFRLPVINEDGRFISNGQKQRMRLQRAD